MERVLEPEYMDTPEEADGYDSMDHAGPNEAFLQRLVELGVDGLTLDIGTGPGHLPVLLCGAHREVRVVALDAAHHMLLHAKRHRAASPVGSRLEFLLGDAKRLPFPDDSFDSVYSNTILHHIPDPLPFLSEAARVVKPSGALLIRDLYRPPNPERARELVDLYAAGANPYQQELFRASLCAALTVEELRGLADRAGLADAALVRDTDRHMSLQREGRSPTDPSSRSGGR